MPFLQNEAPGFSATIESEEAQVYFAGTKDQTNLSATTVLIDSTAVDNNTPTTTLRGGLVMIKWTNGTSPDGLCYPYGQTGKYGPVIGVLPQYKSTLVEGVATDVPTFLWTGGMLKTAELKTGASGVEVPYGSLAALGFQFDDETKGKSTGYLFEYDHSNAGAGTLALTAAMSGGLIHVNHATTLPAISHGLVFTIVSEGTDTITTTEDNILIGVNTGGNTITPVANDITRIEAVDHGGTLAWNVVHNAAAAVTTV